MFIVLYILRVNDKKKERQQKYKEQNKEKLKQKEDVNKIYLLLQTFSNINQVELNNMFDVSYLLDIPGRLSIFFLYRPHYTRAIFLQ